MKTLSLFAVILILTAMTPSRPAYQLFDQQGNATDYDALLKATAEADVILFGELHNNPISHWLQLQLAKDLAASQGKNLVLGAEMFETDDQLVLDEYLQGLMREAQFKKESKIWNNYDTDYAPLVNLAKEKGLAFVASNIPRRYASLVSRNGLKALEALPKEAQKLIAPLPIEVDMELPGYKNMLAMMGGGMHGMSPENFVHAQAIKDATMAHRIVESWEKGKKVLHFNGSYHSDRFEGIGWYLKKYAPKLKVVTISSVEQTDLSKLAPESVNLAHFVICIPKDMTKTYVGE